MNRPNVALAGVAGIAVVGALALPLFASSHREAPYVTEHPKVDATDFYMFNSYEAGRDGFVTIIANYQPLQAAYGGPNYFTLDPDALYEIHVDNDGDAVEDITFQFRFENQLKDKAVQIGPPGQTKTISIPLIQTGQITQGDVSKLNVVEKYRCDVVFGPRRQGSPTAIHDAHTGATRFEKPVDNIGQKTLPDYDAYAAARIFDIALPGYPDGRMFVGQRADPFVVNLGEAFDLVNLNPLGPDGGEPNIVADANVTSIVLELPAAFLTAGHGTILGGWTTASQRQVRLLKDRPTFDEPARERGDWVQLSRLGSPLVNELVIGLRDKDRFNSSQPKDDGQFLDYVTNPALPALLEALFGVRAPTLFPRSDLQAVFLTGIAGLNAGGGVGEMLRLETAIPAVPRDQQDHYGVIAGDLAGYPNGRRPGDDVVDIALRAVMGVLLDAGSAPDGQLPFVDGAHVDATMYGDAFPYVNSPLPGSPNK